MNRAVRVIISGRVQRVGFRYWTEGEASKRQLDGWVRNLDDGTVEALFAGPAEEVDAMIARCHKGPRFASVGDVRALDSEAPAITGFVQYR